jgi:hypothetical protein
MTRVGSFTLSALYAVITAPLLSAVSHAEQTPVAIYDKDPQHLWNRLYRAMAVRVEGGVAFGADNAEPYWDNFDNPRELIAVADEFLHTHAERLEASSLKRALLLNDTWAAFDLAASPRVGADGPEVRRRLARIIGRLRLKDSEIASLPDNYSLAVKSGEFAADVAAEEPQKAFLPPDLFDADGAWVEIGARDSTPIAPFHVEALSGRSVFRVFIRCPGGRQATLAYLETLNLFTTPWMQTPASIGVDSQTHQKTRMAYRRLNPETPQFPAGTSVALVRQLVVINDKLEPVPTPITQKVQFRVYKEIGGSFAAQMVCRAAPADPPCDISRWQALYELVMRRRELLNGSVGGLHAVTAGESEYQLLANPMYALRSEQLRGPVVLSTCRRCHSEDGIFSVNTYTGFASHSPYRKEHDPELLPAGDIARELADEANRKTTQFDWGLLQGLLEATPK